MSDATILLLCAIVALILGLIDAFRSQGQSLTAWAVVILAAGLVVTSWA